MIFKTFVEMAKNHSLFIHIGATLKETLLSFLFVVVLGLGISILLWVYPRLAKVLEPYLVVLNSFQVCPGTPSHCMAGYPSADHHCCRYVCGNLWINSEPVYSFGEISQEKLKLIRTLGGGKKDELLKIVLPSSVPLILANMKVNIGLCLVGVIIGEFIGARQGLGYLIIYGSQTFQ